MPLVWRVVVKPDRDILHEVDLQNVVWCKVPVKRIWILRSNDRDVPVALRPVRIYNDSLIELQPYQPFDPPRVHDGLIDHWHWKLITEWRLPTTCPSKLNLRAVSITAIVCLYILIIAYLRPLDPSIPTVSSTCISRLVVSPVASPAFFYSADTRTAVAIHIVAVITLVIAQRPSVPTCLCTYIDDLPAASRAGVPIFYIAKRITPVSRYYISVVTRMVNLAPIAASFRANSRRIRRPRQTLKPWLVLTIMWASVILIYIPIITVIVSQQLSVSTCLWTNSTSVVEVVVGVVAGVALEGVGARAGEASGVALFAVEVPGVGFFALGVACVVVIMITVLTLRPISHRWMLKLEIRVKRMTIRLLPHPMPYRNRMLRPVIKFNLPYVPMEVLFNRVIPSNL